MLLDDETAKGNVAKGTTDDSAASPVDCSSIKSLRSPPNLLPG